MTNIRQPLSDEVLMAYADGALDAAERSHVEAILAHDLDARNRLAVFQNTGDVLGRVFDQPLHEPVPNRLLDIISAATAQTGATPPLFENARPAVDASGGLSFGSVLRNIRDMAAPRKWGPIAGVAVAASVVILAFNLQIDQEATREKRQVAILKDDLQLLKPSPRDFNQFLDTSVQRSSMSLMGKNDDALVGKIVMSFRDHAGQFCRQYELSKGGVAHTTSGVACRENSGGWSVRAELPTVSHLAVRSNGQHVSVQDGGTARQRSIDEVVDAMIDGEQFSPEDEAALIQSNWRVEK